ncbi:YggT family protein [Candidatus Saccharibacteria bacterium]|nr:YggT family protein [Candidatus Saccharibacteria bacterium]
MEVNREVSKQQTDGGEVLSEKTTTTPTPQTNNQTTTQNSVFKVQYLVYYVLGLVEILLVLRLVFKLLGANAESGFVSMIYSVTAILIAPFTAIFPVTTTQGVTTTAVLEPATIIAILVYALVAWGISALVGVLVAGKE